METMPLSFYKIKLTTSLFLQCNKDIARYSPKVNAFGMIGYIG